MKHGTNKRAIMPKFILMSVYLVTRSNFTPPGWDDGPSQV